MKSMNNTRFLAALVLTLVSLNFVDASLSERQVHRQNFSGVSTKRTSASNKNDERESMLGASVSVDVETFRNLNAAPLFAPALTFPVQSYDEESNHVWAANRFVSDAIDNLRSPESFLTTLWLNGQQLSALMRENRIFIRSDDADKDASFVFEKAFKQKIRESKICAQSSDKKNCVQELTEKLLVLTENFWGSYKKQALDDFKREGLNPAHVLFPQVRAKIKEAFKDASSPAWLAIQDLFATSQNNLIARYDTKWKSSPKAHSSPQYVVNAPKVERQPTASERAAKEAEILSQQNILDRLKRNIRDHVLPDFLKTKVENVPENSIPWYSIDSTSSRADHLRAVNRYTDQIVRSLGCDFMSESFLRNGQIISRLLRKYSTTVTDLTEETSRGVSNWCKSQMQSAKDIVECTANLSPTFARLNKYYWMEIKADLEKNKRKLSSKDIDDQFNKLFFEKALDNPNTPLGKIYGDFQTELSRLKDKSNLTCRTTREDVLSHYKIQPATEMSQAAADALIKRLSGNTGSGRARSLIGPTSNCASFTRQAWQKVGIFPGDHPGWGSAYEYADGLERESVKHNYLSSQYSYQKLTTKDPSSAPRNAVIVYGGGGHGHIETKVYGADLIRLGVTQVLGVGKKGSVAVKADRYYYISDYIDSAARNSPNSIIANGSTNNGRPVLGIYYLVRKI